MHIKTESLWDAETDVILSRFFVHIGITPSRIGFALLKDAVALYSQGEHKMSAINRTLSERYGISVAAAERDTRAVIETAANRNELCKLNEIIGLPFVKHGAPIPSKEFIALVNECLRYPTFRSKLLENAF